MSGLPAVNINNINTGNKNISILSRVKYEVEKEIEKAKTVVNASIASVVKEFNLSDSVVIGDGKITKNIENFANGIQTIAAKIHPFGSYENMLTSWLGGNECQRKSVNKEIAPLMPGLVFKGVNAVANSKYTIKQLIGVVPKRSSSSKELTAPKLSSIRVNYDKYEDLPTEAAYLLEDEKGRHLLVEFSKQRDSSFAPIELHVHAHKDQEDLIDTFYEHMHNWIDKGNFYKNKVLRYVMLPGGREFMEFVDGLKEKKLTWNDIALPAKSLDLIRSNTVSFLQHLDQYKKNGRIANRNLLLAGPPGTGKSMVNDILFNELKDKATFVYVTSKSVESSFHVSRIFDAARILRPAVIIMEDLDLIGSADRFSSNGRASILNELLNQLSGVYDNTGVVVVGSTNQPNIFDEALLRPLRFSTIVPMPLPDKALRSEILQKITKGLELAPDINLNEIAEQTEEFSGAGLTELKELAIQNAIDTGSVNSQKKVRLEQRHLKHALEIIALKKKYQEDTLEDSISN